jgi:hypothetical protein
MSKNLVGPTGCKKKDEDIVAMSFSRAELLSSAPENGESGQEQSASAINEVERGRPSRKYVLVEHISLPCSRCGGNLYLESAVNAGGLDSPGKDDGKPRPAHKWDVKCLSCGRTDREATPGSLAGPPDNMPLDSIQRAAQTLRACLWETIETIVDLPE